MYPVHPSEYLLHAWLLHRQLLKVEIRSKFYFTFAIGFDEAQALRKAGGQYLRPSQWEDITVEVIF
ncbi:MAG: hypothetical protein SPK68_09415, partial [Lachnospiraceae bacterium]|nr:hypothetical protein [Lachnospiraceae bacterium]